MGRRRKGGGRFSGPDWLTQREGLDPQREGENKGDISFGMTEKTGGGTLIICRKKKKEEVENMREGQNIKGAPGKKRKAEEVAQKKQKNEGRGVSLRSAG